MRLTSDHVRQLTKLFKGVYSQKIKNKRVYSRKCYMFSKYILHYFDMFRICLQPVSHHYEIQSCFILYFENYFR